MYTVFLAQNLFLIKSRKHNMMKLVCALLVNRKTSYGVNAVLRPPVSQLPAESLMSPVVVYVVGFIGRRFSPSVLMALSTSLAGSGPLTRVRVRSAPSSWRPLGSS